MFSFEEVILQLENKIALKTLKNWANKIERLTDKKFERKYAKNSKVIPIRLKFSVLMMLNPFLN